MPNLSDLNFHRSVTLICEHSDDGAMGIVINQPSGVQLIDLFEELDYEVDFHVDESREVLSGGPVQVDRGFVIHRPCEQKWQSTLQVSDEVCVTTSLDIIKALADNAAPVDSYIALGYAGWEGGQLEEEILQNSWLTVPATADIIYSLPYTKRWEAAANLLGIDIHHISRDFGHA